MTMLFAGMNSEEKQDLIFWVNDIQDELGVTILFIEHDFLEYIVDQLKIKKLLSNIGRGLLAAL